ncbi:MAG: hypothetical protein R3D55_10135 [Chloroflexota bacterium]
MEAKAMKRPFPEMAGVVESPFASSPGTGSEIRTVVGGVAPPSPSGSAATRPFSANPTKTTVLNKIEPKIARNLLLIWVPLDTVMMNNTKTQQQSCKTKRPLAICYHAHFTVWASFTSVFYFSQWLVTSTTPGCSQERADDCVTHSLSTDFADYTDFSL